METLTKYLAVAGGGAVGAMLRYYLGGSILSRTAAPFPTATFVINITGSFIIGFFLTLITERIPINPNVRLAVAVGFVGAYTTFSTFEYETAKLIEDRDFIVGLLYVALSIVIGFAAVFGGIIAARRMSGISFSSGLHHEATTNPADRPASVAAQGEVVSLSTVNKKEKVESR
jgi:CrcB protein